MNPLSLITKGLLGDLIRITKNYLYPFDITIDYGEKIIDIEVEDNELSILIEQQLLTVETGEEKIEIILE
jgi:hypothetical protein